MGAVSLYHQGRKIENIRISNVNDGYAINGWEAQIIENHSGVVDVFRNPKADPSIVAHYNQPLYVAVKVRSQVVQTPARVLVDFYAVNEKNLTGSHLLRIVVKDPLGKVVLSKKTLVALAGGDVYGQLIAEGVEIPFPAGAAGVFRVEATLVSRPGRVEARGHDEILALDWKSAVLRGKGAVWEVGSSVRSFLKNQKGVDAPAYRDDLERLDWVVISQPPSGAGFRSIPAQQLRDPSGKSNGLLTTFFLGQDFTQRVHQRGTKPLTSQLRDGATPDPAVSDTENYGIRWRDSSHLGQRQTHFSIKTSGNVRLLPSKVGCSLTR